MDLTDGQAILSDDHTLVKEISEIDRGRGLPKTAGDEPRHWDESNEMSSKKAG